MNEQDYLADGFETHRPHLKAVAYRMLGSLSEADDAVQEAWLRLNRTDTSDVENLGGWLTTVVGRVCLDLLRRRTARREARYEAHLPDPIVSRDETVNPEDEVLIADSVGLALLVVLESLGPAERLAFVLHDLFGVPFEEIATILQRTVPAAKQLASRARRRVRTAAPAPDPDLALQRRVVEAFQAASRDGDFAALVTLLHPDVVLRADRGLIAGASWTEIRGVASVAGQAMTFRRLSAFPLPVLVNGNAGLITVADGQPMAVMSFTITGGKVVAIDILADPARLRQLDIDVLIAD
ncbi:sigma-70 family RNA polymerase sigma factor [Kribbella sp. NBC_01484]|uniref:sigma-70 family RNA polymerase sigma factor n=1 Tax=Kribbella sp. NBC_01484 TaxID=2903579 RepID=UPI002E3797CA|nr:sigma-70 family RNA polymerase sigma factor [Kribbella sp. NBC_01484]